VKKTGMAVLLFITAIFCFMSCQRTCPKVTGPNDVSYSAVTAPGCFPFGHYVINSSAEFDAGCIGTDFTAAAPAPVSWDFTNKTYAVYSYGYFSGSLVPYVAGVGNSPTLSNTIVITIGHPSSCGNPVTADAGSITLAFEFSKTTKAIVFEDIFEAE
jgi:hypothetical protein